MISIHTQPTSDIHPLRTDLLTTADVWRARSSHEREHVVVICFKSLMAHIPSLAPEVDDSIRVDDEVVRAIEIEGLHFAETEHGEQDVVLGVVVES